MYFCHLREITEFILAQANFLFEKRFCKLWATDVVKDAYVDKKTSFVKKLSTYYTVNLIDYLLLLKLLQRNN